MKRFFLYSVPFLCALSLIQANPSIQSQMSFTRGAGTTWNADWNGVQGRTYFLAWSLNMQTWNYSPLIAFGSGIKSSGINTQGVGKIFVRLHFVDDAGITTLQQARDADFDNDGIPNYFELETLMSNPLDKSSAGGIADGDALPDGWELFYFGNTTIANPSAVLQADGLTNKEKAELGLNPNVNYSAVTATQPASYSYDAVGRLTGVTAPVAANTFAPDEEGNLLNAQ
jgi:hypothetical protein